MKSEWLLDAMTELESVPAAQSLIVRVSPSRPYFRLSAKGSLGSAEMEYPNDRSVMETFVCTRSVQHAYNFAMVRHAMKSMQTASKVSVRTDDQGILSCQFMVEVSDTIVNFIEFRVSNTNLFTIGHLISHTPSSFYPISMMMTSNNITYFPSTSFCFPWLMLPCMLPLTSFSAFPCLFFGVSLYQPPCSPHANSLH